MEEKERRRRRSRDEGRVNSSSLLTPRSFTPLAYHRSSRRGTATMPNVEAPKRATAVVQEPSAPADAVPVQSSVSPRRQPKSCAISGAGRAMLRPRCHKPSSLPAMVQTAAQREAKRRQRENSVFLDGIQYGVGARYRSFAATLAWVRPQPGEYLCDVGLGRRGKAVLAAALLNPLEAAIGIEIHSTICTNAAERALAAHGAAGILRRSPRGAVPAADALAAVGSRRRRRCGVRPRSSPLSRRRRWRVGGASMSSALD